MKTQPLSIQLETELSDQITAIADALDQPKAWVIEQALKEFVAVQQWQLAAIDEGIAAADAGRLVAHDYVVAWVQSWGQADELPTPKCG
jgi:predicted transcriptional regulator